MFAIIVGLWHRITARTEDLTAGTFEDIERARSVDQRFDVMMDRIAAPQTGNFTEDFIRGNPPPQQGGPVRG